jgi:CRP-like cAMP-binding protein
MGFRSFFDYPSQNEDENQAEDLIFLPHWGERRWGNLLTYTSTIRFQAGDILIHQGESDRSFYIITEGTVEVVIAKGQNQKAQRTLQREAGSIIGEQGFLDGKPRSATIRAVTAGSLLRLSETSFEILAAREPDMARDILFDLARLLSIKLRQANQFIARIIK